MKGKLLGVSLSLAASSAAGAAWIPYVSIDPIFDTRVVATHTFSPSGELLGFSCGESAEQFTVSVIWPRHLGEGTAPVFLRFDDHEPILDEWAIPADVAGRWTEYPGGTLGAFLFAKVVASSGTLAMRTYTPDGEALTAVFDLSGSSAAIQPVFDACEKYLP